MNLYKLHTDPESLDHHKIAQRAVAPLFYEMFADTPVELKKREAAIALDTLSAYRYAMQCKKSRFTAGEHAIAKNAYFSLGYACDVLKGPFPEGEAAIASNGTAAISYAEQILKGPFSAGEAVIFASRVYAARYRAFLDGLKK